MEHSQVNYIACSPINLSSNLSFSLSPSPFVRPRIEEKFINVKANSAKLLCARTKMLNGKNKFTALYMRTTQRCTYYLFMRSSNIWEEGRQFRPRHSSIIHEDSQFLRKKKMESEAFQDHIIYQGCIQNGIWSISRPHRISSAYSNVSISNLIIFFFTTQTFRSRIRHSNDDMHCQITTFKNHLHYWTNKII